MVCATPATMPAQPSATRSGRLLEVITVVGCVAQDGPTWILTNATVPLRESPSEGKAPTGVAVTVQTAKAQPLGKERYRLIGPLDVFGVTEHKGHKVLAKGLLVGDAKNLRLNLLGFSLVAPTC